MMSLSGSFHPVADGIFDCEPLLKRRCFEHEDFTNEILIHTARSTGNILISEVVEL
jgi:hypothetical protein